METNLTRRQAHVLELIERGPVPPTLREIGEIMGIRSTNGVNDHLRALERKGRIARSDMKSRHLTVKEPLTAEERVYFGLPVMHRCESCGQALPPGRSMESFEPHPVSEQKIAG
jgi:SOS-response transcriptional repressor LexA